MRLILNGPFDGWRDVLSVIPSSLRYRKKLTIAQAMDKGQLTRHLQATISVDTLRGSGKHVALGDQTDIVSWRWMANEELCTASAYVIQ